MHGRTLRIIFALSVLAIGVVAAPVPALGKQTGTVGYYSLNDAKTSPGVTAKYRYESIYDGGNYYYWRLRRLVVQAPNVRAVSGKSSQSVGWQFTVQRIECAVEGCGSWYIRYTSPTFVATASASANAAFTTQSVSVRLPVYGNGPDYYYRVIVKMFWYKPGGAVQGTASARVAYYKYIEGSTTRVETGDCAGYDPIGYR